MGIFLIFIIFAIILIIHNHWCYKNQKVLRILRKKTFRILHNDYYDLQFVFGNMMAVIIALVAAMNLFNSYRYILEVSFLSTAIFFSITEAIVINIAQRKKYITFRRA